MKKGFILFVVLLYALYASAGNLELYFGDNKCVNGATYVSALQMTDQYEWKGVTYTSWEQDSRLFLHGDVGTQVSLEVTTDAAVQFCGIDGQCVMTQPNVTKTKTGALKSTVEDTVIDKMFETEGNENPEDISEPITVHVTAWETSKPSEKISVKVIMSNSLTPVGPECYYFSVENKVARKGRVTMLPVEMINDDGVVSFQCDVVLPEGVCVHKEDGAYAIEASDRFDNTHTLSSSQLDNGKIRIVSISMQNHAYKGNDGVLFTIPIEVDDALADESNVTLTIENIQLTKTNLEKYVADAVTANLTIGRKFTPGDVNDDGEFTILDASMVIAYILQQDPVNGIREAADVNGDGEISVLDASLVISYVLEDRPVALSTSTNRIAKQTPVESAQLYIEDGKAYLSIPNASRFVAGQFELDLPMDAEVASISIVGDNAMNHSLVWSKGENGNIKVVIYSLSNDAFKDDNLIEVTFDKSNSFGTLSVSNVLMTSEDANIFDEVAFANSSVEIRTDGISDISNDIFFYTDGRNLVIVSTKHQVLTLTSADGKYRTIDVEPGKNTNTLNCGYYLINNKKIIIR